MNEPVNIIDGKAVERPLFVPGSTPETDIKESVNSNLPPQNCSICSAVIPSERVETLIVLRIANKDFMCIKCAESQVKKVKGVYSGYSGHNLLFVDDLGAERIDRNIN